MSVAAEPEGDAPVPAPETPGTRPSSDGRDSRSGRHDRVGKPQGHAVLRGGWSRGAGLLVALGVLVFVVFLSVAVGTREVPLSVVWDALTEFDDGLNDHLVVRTLRVPRTFIGLMVGLGLGVSGALMQGLTRNPLADPALLGIQSGAGLAVVIGISYFGIATLTGYVWLAFVGAALAGAVVYALGAMGPGGATPVKLALAGAALSALLASFIQTLLLMDSATLDRYRFWIVGALAGREAEIAWDMLPFVAVGVVVAAVAAGMLNMLALGDDMARSLGAVLWLARVCSAVAIVLLCGAATAAAGPIAFVGLTVPHMARAIVGPDYRWIVPWSAVLAPILLLTADVVGRVVARPGELQVGIVTAFIGAPVFVALVRRQKLAEL